MRIRSPNTTLTSGSGRTIDLNREYSASECSLRFAIENRQHNVAFTVHRKESSIRNGNPASPSPNPLPYLYVLLHIQQPSLRKQKNQPTFKVHQWETHEKRHPNLLFTMLQLKLSQRKGNFPSFTPHQHPDPYFVHCSASEGNFTEKMESTQSFTVHQREGKR